MVDLYNILIINHLKNSLLIINTLAKTTKNSWKVPWISHIFAVSLLYKG